MGPPTILVVDDEELLREVTCLGLEDAGLAVAQARDAAEALQRIQDDPTIALMVTDVCMPGDLDGLDLLKSARALRPDLRVVVVSGGPTHAAMRETLSASHPFLPKPFVANQLLKLIEDQLGPWVPLEGSR